ncbi:MAG: GGDEF domain-containing protein [Synergistaceae bacterium]|jgi:diguanylate cyclase (GGDEF)-like protein|nr:GGDEF domain-containing protein [Synergistaceae bacterium]
MEKNAWHYMIVMLVGLFFILVLGFVIFMSVKNASDMQNILEESVKNQVISISIAARDKIDPDKFVSWTSPEGISTDQAAYSGAVDALRQLQWDLGAQYIYALQEIDGKYRCVLDTDENKGATFEEYTLSHAQELAFLGLESTEILNVSDPLDDCNSGAVPVFRKGKVVGILCVDIPDTFLKQNTATARFNMLFLAGTTAVVMVLMMLAMTLLAHRMYKMQKELYHMANYDSLTKLPNRQYLISYLTRISSDEEQRGNRTKTPFALLFVDMDNFKKVNDGSGHDAGDELLRATAVYLENVHKNSKAFRPAAGALNVSARVGGDEFVQIVPGISTEEGASAAARKVLDEFGTQPLIERYIRKYKVGLSVGVALYPWHSTNFNVLIKYADIAMYNAKQSGKHRYCVYEDGMGEEEDGL